MRGCKLCVVLLAAAIAGPALAENPPPPVKLWRELYAGMTKADVERFYPKFKGELYPGCPVDVLARFKGGKLLSVYLHGNDKLASCSTKAGEELMTEYGEGEKGSSISSTSIATATSISTSTSSTPFLKWHADGRKILFIVRPGKVTWYSVIYTMRQEGDDW